MTDWEQPSLLDGTALKNEGMARALDASMPWPDMAMAWMNARNRGDTFTSEDVTNAIGLPRGDVGKDTNNAVGAVMNAAARATLIRRIGYVSATRRNSHGAAIGLWVRQ